MHFHRSGAKPSRYHRREPGWKADVFAPREGLDRLRSHRISLSVAHKTKVNQRRERSVGICRGNDRRRDGEILIAIAPIDICQLDGLQYLHLVAAEVLAEAFAELFQAGPLLPCRFDDFSLNRSIQRVGRVCSAVPKTLCSYPSRCTSIDGNTAGS